MLVDQLTHCSKSVQSVAHRFYEVSFHIHHNQQICKENKAHFHVLKFIKHFTNICFLFVIKLSAVLSKKVKLKIIAGNKLLKS